MKRYLWLLVVAVLASAAGLLAMRQLRQATPVAQATAEVPTAAMALVLGSQRLDPEFASVPKGHQVALEVRNDRAAAVTLVLQGYEDRFSAGPIAPGQTWRGMFVADRPGEAFPWLVDGVAVGRLTVSGSHLVEGHR